MKLTMLVISSFFALSSHASESFELALKHIKDNAFRSAQVDWETVEPKAREINQAVGEDRAIQYLVRALDDPHTSYRPPFQNNHHKGQVTRPQKPIAEQKSAVLDVEVLQINAWVGQDQIEAAKTVRAELSAATQQSTCGIILDFAYNSGGNMWPMVLGLAPLLDNGHLASFVQADGSDSKIAKIDNEIHVSGNSHFLNLHLPKESQQTNNPIAVVIGNRTASSGEITSMLFYGQNNVKFFGKTTSGFTSANRVFTLPNNKRLVLTTSQTQDRYGFAHIAGIKPHVKTNNAIQKAAEWVNQQCSKST